MKTLSVVTPSYGPDLAHFDDLHRSVLEFTSSDTVHHVFVPSHDWSLFAPYEGPRCRVWLVNGQLPRRYVKVPRMGLWINLLRPWPPVRGWVLQQIVKLAATGDMRTDVALVADSDVVLVRPVTAERALIDGRVLLHRLENGVHPLMTRHVLWHHVARDLLKLPPPPEPPLPDYMSPLTFWEPATVRKLQERLRETTGRHWVDAFGSRLHVSEFMLYGIYVDEVLSATDGRPPSDTAICHKSPDESPMDLRTALDFAERLGPDAIGMMISSKSGTPHDVRRAAIRHGTEVARRTA
ncbi:hypothetical protein SAMN05444920_10496 [Nonomuraea solani]|uniref:Uncharacterized protein n=1 Tax=Nonomuraea solani TaxID=1144553 RepID=A0A1H6CKV8_9ACTN|nr:DUF6492 family protein [Nonomuraea solani]SEG73600.1 hypothetical protein SAMN05444920_10496 [Nonomuraea solani]